MHLAACAVLTVCLLCPPSGTGQDIGKDFFIPQVKASTYCGKWKLGDLLARYCDKASWSHEKGEEVILRARLKKTGEQLVARFQLVSTPDEKEKVPEGNPRLTVISEYALIDGKKVQWWQDKVFEKEYLATGEMKIAGAKADRYYGGTVGNLLAKYCDRPAWAFNKEKNRVEFRGQLKKKGGELAVWFKVLYGPIDRRNTRDDWLVLEERATLAGKPLGMWREWREQVFVEETRKAREKAPPK
jgi:hypothetical protein